MWLFSWHFFYTTENKFDIVKTALVVVMLSITKCMYCYLFIYFFFFFYVDLSVQYLTSAFRSKAVVANFDLEGNTWFWDYEHWKPKYYSMLPQSPLRNIKYLKELPRKWWKQAKRLVRREDLSENLLDRQFPAHQQQQLSILAEWDEGTGSWSLLIVARVKIWRVQRVSHCLITLTLPHSEIKTLFLELLVNRTIFEHFIYPARFHLMLLIMRKIVQPFETTSLAPYHFLKT